MKKWDVIIVGCGPAGIFAAMELHKKAPCLSVLLLDKGNAIANRNCPKVGALGGCLNCSPCSITSGWGGAGAFSDGKLTLTTKFGGFLLDYLEEKDLEDLIHYVDSVWLDFGGSSRIFGSDEKAIKDLVLRAARAGLQMIPAVIRHLGSDNSPIILENMYRFLKDKAEIRTRTAVKEILVKDNKAVGVLLENGQEEYANHVIVAPGREGSDWFSEQVKALGLPTDNNPVDIGVRVEIPSVIADEITDKVWEPKIHYYSKAFDDLVRTFCVCPHGEVVTENSGGVVTVNGHSFVGKKTENTNFALLVSKTFTEPFKEPITYGKYIASLANMLSGGVMVQRLGDLWEGRRSLHSRLMKSMVKPTLKEATPGDLTLVLPYRYIKNLLEMLEALDRLMPGIWSKSTLLYGVEVKFYSLRVKVSLGMETDIENLYAAGDGAGVTRSLAQASVSGVAAARTIVDKI